MKIEIISAAVYYILITIRDQPYLVSFEFAVTPSEYARDFRNFAVVCIIYGGGLKLKSNWYSREQTHI